MKTQFYELTYIINPVLDDEKFKEIVDYVNELITSNGGEIDEVDEWGLRSFAYDIDGKSNGYYVNMYFDAPADLIEKAERSMKINDDILRYLTLKYDAKMKRHLELRRKGEAPTIFDEEIEEEDSDDDN
ncbi:MAG TPA: 30S ribosomal protein S6 [Balneolaceae bacterium]|nr:30S ribosomal protein S6 [Balneolaceae bacterium]